MPRGQAFSEVQGRLKIESSPVRLLSTITKEMETLYRIHAMHVVLQAEMSEDPNPGRAGLLASFREIFKWELSNYAQHWKSRQFVLNDFYYPDVDKWLEQRRYTREQLLNMVGISNEKHAEEILHATLKK